MRKFLSFFLLLAIPATTFAQASIASRLDAYIKPFVDASQFSGQVYVARDGKPVYDKAFGYANAELGVKNTPETKIGIASITKMMTDVILTRLVAEKKISMDHKVSKYIPDFPNGEKITVDMLYNHRSGIPHRVMPPEMETVPYTAADMVEKIKLAKLEFEPGTRRLYSSAGYSLLARILEIVSGKTYSQLLDDYVFAPAGMKNSIEFDGTAIIPGRANDYFVDENGLLNAPVKDYSFLVGAGSVLSTARDVHAFAMAIVHGTYGEDVRADYLKKLSLSGTGSTNGHSSELRVNGANHYSYVVVMNEGSGAGEVVMQAIRDIMEGKPVTQVAVPKPKALALPAADLEKYLGTFERETGGSFTVNVRNGTLFAGDIRLVPTAKDCFWDYKYYGNVCFMRDANGSISYVSWASPGITSKWVRK